RAETGTPGASRLAGGRKLLSDWWAVRRPLLRFVARLLPYLERCGVAVTARAPIANSLLDLMHRQRLIARAPARSRCRYRAGGECRQDCSRCYLNCRTTPDVRFRHRTTAPSSRRRQCD